MPYGRRHWWQGAGTVVGRSPGVAGCEHGSAFGLMFGPGYEGIARAAATAMACATMREEEGGRDIGFAYNRKEAKAHGEGGTLVGAELAGRKVIIVDDVLTDGASKRESVDMIRAAGAEPAGVVIALDRMERRDEPRDGPRDETEVSTGSAVAAFEGQYRIPVYAIATLDDIMDWLKNDNSGAMATHADAVASARSRCRAVGAIRRVRAGGVGGSVGRRFGSAAVPQRGRGRRDQRRVKYHPGGSERARRRRECGPLR